MASTYSDAGIDVKKAVRIHEAMAKIIAGTKNEFCEGEFGHYAGIVKIGEEMIAITNDGVGSKLLVAQKMKKFDTVGIDCVAMVVNDLICIGAKPIALVDYIALQKQDETLVLELMKGLAQGCVQSGCAIVGGETAILPEIVNGFDLEATCIGRVEGGVVDGRIVKEGDAVVGLASSGLHSNGYTLARKVLSMEKWGKEMLTPATIYVKPVLEMIKECEVHGLANITGGAFSKMSRLTKRSGCGFLLDGVPTLPPIFAELRRGVPSDYEMYRTFNCGIGFCVVCEKEDAKKVIAVAKKYGIGAQVIGQAIAKKDILLKKDGKEISLL
ncbi:phosphoribosylformylglycinamidine cyclo-ligase [Candidatus Micrarchaeota archaeon CG11_big_fil_rev_8_21_14_0_20_47_5]|nr:MAG: phosphoribosylformylglycinamidine cyclo-ligase [Candidatus Micrarchaeota archaeon CG1_02_47_40]PIN83944.1 MAG: phosphoribosylformylglycinamidine cyclo-ligase [Candidatus Micrarchaeota archaeon CG11_big_fil_rev_8_21_14_0_20_47_5]